MAIIKCKMCGGDLNIAENNSVAVCEYCGTQQTVPSADNEKKLTLFGRANRLRMACEFDKAAGVYESIVVDFPEEAEAYWGLVLCKYGIEYVDDPATGKKIPTCHRSSFDSVMDDSNLEQALENADVIAQKVYREEAKQFERIRKGILEVSSSEKPYDIFICYKETDEKGDRTLDSVLAQDLYAVLTDKGYRVFFSRITLQGKLGEAYEPYIFAALNSAKVMLAVGTCYEYYNAVWVKNEWSRYIKLCEADKSKHLIPCYKDLDPEDMPKEFKHLQGADLGKMGAIQDILFNMEKYIPLKKTVKENVVVQQSAETTKVQALLERAFLFLEDGDWKAAKEYCEKALDIDPKCAEGYLGKLMVELRICRRAQLAELGNSFSDRSEYEKITRFGNDALRAELSGYLHQVEQRLEDERIEHERRAEERRIAAAATAKKTKKVLKIVIPILVVIAVIAIASVFVVTKVVIPNGQYNNAVALMENDQYEEAIAAFEAMGGYKDSEDLILETKYVAATALLDAGNIVDAYEAMVALDGYKDSAEKADSIYDQYTLERLKSAKVGDYVSFGSYEQDNDLATENEPIEWIVLKRSGNSLLLTTKYGIDCKKYNAAETISWNDMTQIFWEFSTIREWLNGEFMQTAFSEKEQGLISKTSINYEGNSFYRDTYNPAPSCEDRVFLLSVTEANTYFSSDLERQISPTAYAKAQGAHIKTSTGACEWLLRTPGYRYEKTHYMGHVAYVDNDGVIDEDGFVARSSNSAVRPAMWIDLNA